MNLSLTLSRASLSLADLVITNDPNASSFHLPEDGLARPSRVIRRTYAPPSDWVSGQLLMAAVEDAGTLPLSIYAHGNTSAALEAAIAVLEAALTQFTYDITVSIDGQSRTWAADPELPQWGVVDSGMVRAHIARASVVVPINPA